MKYSWNIKVGVEKSSKNVVEHKGDQNEVPVCAKCDWRKLWWPKLKVRQKKFRILFLSKSSERIWEWSLRLFRSEFWSKIRFSEWDLADLEGWRLGECWGENVQIFVENFDKNRRFFWWKCKFEKVDFFWWKWGVENADFRSDLQCLKRPFFAEITLGNVM